MDIILRAIIVVVILVVLTGLLISSGTSSMPDPTPTPDNAIGQIVEGYRPLVEASARSVDAGTTASLTDTQTAHPEPAPTLSEIWALPLALFCSVCVAFGFPSLAFIVWVLARNNERVALVQKEHLAV